VLLMDYTELQSHYFEQILKDPKCRAIG
jgi:hypothetical protein